MKDNNQKNLKYGHVGRPTNEEVKEYNKKKSTKIIIATLLVFVLVGGILLFFNKDTIDFSSIMGNSSTKGKVSLTTYFRNQSLKNLKKSNGKVSVIQKNSPLKVITKKSKNGTVLEKKYYIESKLTVNNTKNTNNVISIMNFGLAGSDEYVTNAKRKQTISKKFVLNDIYETKMSLPSIGFSVVNIMHNEIPYEISGENSKVKPTALITKISNYSLSVLTFGNVYSGKIEAYENGRVIKISNCQKNILDNVGNRPLSNMDFSYGERNPNKRSYVVRLYSDTSCKKQVKAQKIVASDYVK